MGVTNGKGSAKWTTNQIQSSETSCDSNNTASTQQQNAPAALCRKRTPENAHHFYVKSCGFTDCPTSKVSGVGIEMAQFWWRQSYLFLFLWHWAFSGKSPGMWELHCGEIKAGSQLNAVYSHRSGSMLNFHVCFPVHAHLHEVGSGSFYDFLGACFSQFRKCAASTFEYPLQVDTVHPY